jgi:hypothetical protein
MSARTPTNRTVEASRGPEQRGVTTFSDERGHRARHTGEGEIGLVRAVEVRLGIISETHFDVVKFGPNPIPTGTLWA